MFKNRFLNTTALFLAPDDEGKTAAAERQAARDAIPVTVIEKEDEPAAEAEAEDAEPEDEETETEEEEEGEEEGAEVEAKSAEDADKKAKKLERQAKRAYAKQKDAERERDDLKRQLEALSTTPKKELTAEDVEKLADTKAEQKSLEREFIKTCNILADAAEKVDKEFANKYKDVGEDIGLIPSFAIGVLEDLDNAGNVLAHLVENEDEYEKVFYGKLSPAKMTAELVKLSEKLKPKRRISQAPAPIKEVGARNNSNNPINDKDSDTDWIRKREAQVAERNRNGYRMR